MNFEFTGKKLVKALIGLAIFSCLASQFLITYIWRFLFSQSTYEFLSFLNLLFGIMIPWTTYKANTVQNKALKRTFQKPNKNFNFAECLKCPKQIEKNDQKKPGYKPDRCHHCSSCRKCILEMDHHCYFIDNCVGYFNYRYYYQLLFYGFLSMVYAFTASSYIGYSVLSYQQLEYPLWKFLLCIIFWISVIGFSGFGFISVGWLFIAHTRYSIKNSGTIEFLGNRRELFHYGILASLKDKFISPFYFFIPIQYEMKDEGYLHYRKGYEFEFNQKDLEQFSQEKVSYNNKEEFLKEISQLMRKQEEEWKKNIPKDSWIDPDQIIYSFNRVEIVNGEIMQ